ncbi:hypothetical protein ACS0TY_001142 [Phlomoides rotata]
MIEEFLVLIIILVCAAAGNRELRAAANRISQDSEKIMLARQTGLTRSQVK